MRRIYAFFISLQLFMIISQSQVHAQDTIMIPLNIKVGLEVSGPVIYYTGKNNLSVEGYISADLNEKTSPVLNAGYVKYNYSQYNYEYLTNGIFIRAGADINMLNPKKSMGIYWVGTGLRYGLSRFTSEIPSFLQDNFYGTITSSIAARKDWVHFLEISPGVRARIFKNISIGWTMSLRMKIYSTAPKDFKPIYVPGFGNSGKIMSTGLSYFLVWNIQYKKKQVIIKKEVPEETDENAPTVPPGFRQQSSGIRQ
jgi:hypothetical protein